jgi:hypothetical protein
MESYKTSLLLVLFLTFQGLVCNSAKGQTLYDNGSAVLGAGGYGYYADTGNPSYSEAGNVFAPSLSGTADTISFAGIYYGGVPPTTDNFVLTLYSTSSNAPDSVLSTSTLKGVSMAVLGSGESETIYQITGNLNTPFSLSEGTPYYLGISDTTDPYENFSVAVSANPGGATTVYSLLAGTPHTFVPSTDSLAFTISAPEPSAWSLMLIIMAALGLLLARRRSSLLL